MVAALVDLWLWGSEPEQIFDEASVALARGRVEELASSVGLNQVKTQALVTCVSELAMNQVRYVDAGWVSARPIERGGVPGVEVIAADRGPGISELGEKLLGLGSSERGLGIGLAGISRLADEFDIDTRIGEGLCVRVRSFIEAPKRRMEVGVFGRALPGEPESGDGAIARVDDDQLSVTVVDGIGHGRDAHQASHAVLDAMTRVREPELGALFECAEAVARKNRGAVMGSAIAKSGSVDYAIVGDIRGELITDGKSRHFVNVPGYLGGRQPWNLKVHRLDTGQKSLLMMCSDGITSAAKLESEHRVLTQAPAVIAEYVVDRFARDHDDALAVVARL